MKLHDKSSYDGNRVVERVTPVLIPLLAHKPGEAKQAVNLRLVPTALKGLGTTQRVVCDGLVRIFAPFASPKF